VARIQILILCGVLLFGFGIFLNETEPDLIFDWFNREGSAIVLWWGLTTLAGVVAFPLLFHLLPSLPSRGYALARIAGLMLTGWLFWYVASLGLWANTVGAMVFSWLIILIFGAYIWQRRSGEHPLGAWFKDHQWMILMVEVFYIGLFVSWSIFRIHNPEVASTEKPMEMMFINSIRESAIFPPNDGWLAGYSISYYYFGYVITAMLAELSGVNTGIAFSLMLAQIFALTGIGILGLVYDLVRYRGGSVAAGLRSGLLALFLLIFAGNLGASLLELPWNGRGNIDGDAAYFDFWDVPERGRLAVRAEGGAWQELATGDPLSEEAYSIGGYTSVTDSDRNGLPDTVDNERAYEDWNFWWWFRYSRVINDRFLNDDPIGVQPIAEFPHFSFILGDIHPHVLALPFALLALTVAAGLALGGKFPEWWQLLLMAIFVGGMVFMNSWDAIYLPFLIGAEALRRLLNNQNGRLTDRDVLGIVGFGTLVVALFVMLYLPWLLSFTSQAGGFYLNLIWNTAPQQLFLQFGAFAIIILPFVGISLWQGRDRIAWGRFLVTFVLLAVILVGLFPMFGVGVYNTICGWQASPDELLERDPNAIERLGGAACTAQRITLGGVLPATDGFWGDFMARRAESYISQGLILFVIVAIAFRLFGKPNTSEPDHAKPSALYHPATAFALLTLAAGLVLILAPDFVYLVDNFRVRINTVFKLYYQGWIFLSVAAGYGTYEIYRLRPQASESFTSIIKSNPLWVLGQASYTVVVGIVILLVAVYPMYAARSRGLQESNVIARFQTYEQCLNDTGDQDTCLAAYELSLDGRPSAVSAAEYEVIQCLLDSDTIDSPIVAEAPYNGGYNARFGRVATLTGYPNLLGWINHQGQWRGPTYDTVTEVVRNANGQIVDSREIQTDTLYQTEDWAVVDSVIERYGIDYVMVGEAEYNRYADYRDGLEKFSLRYPAVCAAGDVALYYVGG